MKASYKCYNIPESFSENQDLSQSTGILHICGIKVDFVMLLYSISQKYRSKEQRRPLLFHEKPENLSELTDLFHIITFFIYVYMYLQHIVFKIQNKII